MSEEQPRRRGKSAATDLRLALKQAAALQQQKNRDESYISDCKLVQTRIKTLSMLASHRKQEKLSKLRSQIEKLQREVASLTVENETLKQELASVRARTTVTGHVSAVADALAKYEASKQGGQTS